MLLAKKLKVSSEYLLYEGWKPNISRSFSPAIFQNPSTFILKSPTAPTFRKAPHKSIMNPATTTPAAGQTGFATLLQSPCWTRTLRPAGSAPQAAFEGEFPEGQSRTMSLDEVNSEVLGLLVH